MPERCLHPSVTNWPSRGFVGRWKCSLEPGHKEEHCAYFNHDPKGEVAWRGPWAPEQLAPAPEVCGCGDADCLHFELSYPFCPGCGDHHRAPVGFACPVEVSSFRWHCERMIEMLGPRP